MKNNPIQEIKRASKVVLAKKSYKKAFGILSMLIFLTYILLPVWLTAGNTISFQISLLRPKDFVLFVILSLFTALLIVMQVYIYKSKKKKNGLVVVGQGGVSIYSALFAGLMATAACSSCIAGLIGFLGAGSIFFVLEYQWYFVAGALVIVAISLYFIARQVNGGCNLCVQSTDITKKV